jgi:hypothetical protein
MLIWILHLNTIHRVFNWIQSVIYRWKALDKSFPKTYNKPYFGKKRQKLGYPRKSKRFRASTCKNPFECLSDPRDNVYNNVECYLEPPPFYCDEWEDERGRSKWNYHDEVDTMCRGVRNSNYNMNRDNEDIHKYHSW